MELHAGRRRAPAGRHRAGAKAILRSLVHGAVAHHHIGDACGNSHRCLLQGRTGPTTAIVDTAEELQIATTDILEQADLCVIVNGECAEAIDVFAA
ncbi:hypothetical protein D3C72_2343500 [compost metagenome]